MMYYALQLILNKEITVFNIEDRIVLDMIDDGMYYQDHIITHHKDGIIIDSKGFCTFYYFDSEKRKETLNNLVVEPKGFNLEKLLYCIEATEQSNKMPHVT